MTYADTASIADEMKSGLGEAGVTAADVLAATVSVAPCFGIVDSRIEDWKITIVGTIAGNASCGGFVLGNARANPRTHGLVSLRVTATRKGVPLSEGLGVAVQGLPAEAVSWLAKGDVILSGSLVRLEPVVAGEVLEMELHGIGRCVARLV